MMNLKEKFNALPDSVQAGVGGAAAIWGLSALGVISGSFTSVLLISVATGIITSVSYGSAKEWWIKRKEAQAVLEKERKEELEKLAALEKEHAIANDPLFVGIQWVKDNLQHLPQEEQDRMNTFLYNFELAAQEVLHDDTAAAIPDRVSLTNIISKQIPSMMATLIRVAPIHRTRADENGDTPLRLYQKGVETYHQQVKVMINDRHERATARLGTQVQIAEHHLVRAGGVENQADITSSPEVRAENEDKFKEQQRF